MMITNTYSLKKPSQNNDFNGYFPMKVSAYVRILLNSGLPGVMVAVI
jgi:hypothetical protein